MADYYEAAGTAVKRVLDLVKYYRDKSYNGMLGLQTGYQMLDNITGGMHPGELIVIAGRPAMGKTALALNIVRKMAIDGDCSVGFVSLEESNKTIAEKLLSMDSAVDIGLLRTEDISKQNMRELEESADRIDKAKLFVSGCEDTGIDSVCAVCDAMKKDNNIQVVFIDYIQLIKSNVEKGSKELEMADTLYELKCLAARLQIPVVVMSQLSREVDKRADHRPTIRDFSVKDIFDFMVDTVLFIYRDDYYDLYSDRKGIAEIIVAKHGNGRAGTAKLVWNPVFYQFC